MCCTRRRVASKSRNLLDAPLVDDLLDRRQPYFYVPRYRRIALRQPLDGDGRPEQPQEVAFLGIRQLLALALDRLAPGQYLLVLLALPRPVDGEDRQFRAVSLQLLNYAVGVIEQVADTGARIAAQAAIL